MIRTVHCIKLGCDAEGLSSPPWPGELGQRIFKQVSKQAWMEWLRQQTILINEHRLSPLDPEHREFLAAQVEAYFFGDGIQLPKQWRKEND